MLADAQTHTLYAKNMAAEKLLTKQQLAPRLKLKVRGVESLVKAGKIPVLRISPKCVRFDWERVKAALQAFEIKAVK